VVFGDRVRRNIATVDPSERLALRDAFIKLNTQHRFGGSRADPVPGGVTWWFKQDEIHQATHVHGGPEFLPWHRVIVNRLEELLRKVDSRLSIHYWDWTQDPRAIPNANLGNGKTGNLSLFTEEFMGYGGDLYKEIDVNSTVPHWLNAEFYKPDINDEKFRADDPFDIEHSNPADPPKLVRRKVGANDSHQATPVQDTNILMKKDYQEMRKALEPLHNNMHGFVFMGDQHISFRDPFVFLLHSNVDRLFALWQLDPAHPERLNPNTLYGNDSQDLNHNVEPWSTGHSIDSFGHEHFARPWCAPENEGIPHTYKDRSVFSPPLYDTNVYSLDVILKAKHIPRPVGIRGNLAERIGFPQIPTLSARGVMQELIKV
jgi:hypothetical protein